MSSTRVIKSKHYNERPYWFRGLNSVWKATYPLGTKSTLDRDNLIKASRKITGLDDFGKDFWVEPLDRMIKSIKEEAQLHPVGYFITRQRIINMLNLRLRAEWWFKKHPEILEQPLYPVWMIMGLQRTGTTKLHRLLTADPENRVLRSWEAINPAPLCKKWKIRDKRPGIAKTSEKALRLMAPGFFAIHPVEHLAPEEDILLLDNTFLSTTTEATMHVPSYASWLEKTDQTLAYSYMVKLMKFLQWQQPAKRWILKSPHHMEFMEQADKHFEDVTFLWTHRDVNRSIPSFLSMVSHSRVIFSDQVDKHVVAKHWVRKTGYMLEKGINFRKGNPNERRFIDIHYNHFIHNSLDVMTNIYDHAGAMDAKLEAKIKLANEKNPQGKYGVHEYSLADFGLTENNIKLNTKTYQDYFNGKSEEQSI